MKRINKKMKQWLAIAMTPMALHVTTLTASDPLFDLEAIMTEPVAYEMLESEVVELGDAVLDLYRRYNQPLGGEPDPAVKHCGTQSLRFDPGEAGEPPDGFDVRRFLHVPGVAHRWNFTVCR